MCAWNSELIPAMQLGSAKYFQIMAKEILYYSVLQILQINIIEMYYLCCSLKENEQTKF